MPVLLKYHYYVNIKKPKETKHISSIIPMENRVVSESLFKDFEDTSNNKKDTEYEIPKS